MPQSFRQLLVGRTLLDGQVLPPTTQIKSTRAIVIEKFLGEERFGEIFSAHFAIDNAQSFLLKIPSQPLSETHKYLQNEIEILEMLQEPGNPHIPFVQQTFLLGGSKRLPLYLFCLLEPYSTRFRGLAQGEAVPHLEALQILYVLTKTLCYLEEKQIVHGDLNRDTVKFCEKMPVLAHWSVAKNLQQANPNAAKYGDPTWLPPEALTIEKDSQGVPSLCCQQLDTKADIWGLGLLFMFYLTGHTPFDDFSPDGDIETNLRAILELSLEKIASKYRSYCKRILNMQFMGGQAREDMLWNEIHSLYITKWDIDNTLAALDTTLVRRFSLETKINRRNELLKAGRAKAILFKEFYLEMLFFVFDVCTATLKKRVTARELASILDGIFPGLAKQTIALAAKQYIPSFEPMKETTRIIKNQRFVPKTESLAQQARSRPRHSMKSIASQKLQNMVSEEMGNYLSQRAIIPKLKQDESSG